MLHIMLLVLKIIGIILAILLVFCVLILLIPFRYLGKGDFKGRLDTESKACLTAHSFLSIVRFRFSVLGKDMKYVLRVFGIPIMRGIIDVEKEADVPLAVQETSGNKPFDEQICQMQDDTNDNTLAKDSKSIKTNKTEKNKKRFNGRFKNKGPVTVDKYAGIMDIEEVPDNGKTSESENDSDKTIMDRIKKLVKTIKKLPVYVKSIKQKYRELKSFLKSEKTKIAFYYTKDILKNVFLHAKPKKLEAKVIFGFDSPDKTGQALGVLGLVYGVIKVDQEKLQITPDFEKKIFEGTVYMKGNFVLGYVLVQLFKLYSKKEVHDIIEKFNG